MRLTPRRPKRRGLRMRQLVRLSRPRAMGRARKRRPPRERIRRLLEMTRLTRRRLPTRRTAPARLRLRRQVSPLMAARLRRPRSAAAAVRARPLRPLRLPTISFVRKWPRRARTAVPSPSSPPAGARASSPLKSASSGIRILLVTSPTSRACACTSRVARTGSQRSSAFLYGGAKRSSIGSGTPSTVGTRLPEGPLGLVRLLLACCRQIMARDEGGKVVFPGGHLEHAR